MVTRRSLNGQVFFALVCVMALTACSSDQITSNAECVADLADEANGARKSGEASANCHVDTNEPGDGGAGGTGGEGGGASLPTDPEHQTITDARCAGHVDFEVCKYSDNKFAACYHGECLPYQNAGAKNGHGGCSDVTDCPNHECREEVCHKGLCMGFWHPEYEGTACLVGSDADATCHNGACIVSGP